MLSVRGVFNYPGTISMELREKKHVLVNFYSLRNSNFENRANPKKTSPIIGY